MPRAVLFLITMLAFCAPVDMIEMLALSIVAGDLSWLPFQTDLPLIGLWASGILLMAALVAALALNAERRAARRWAC